VNPSENLITQAHEHIATLLPRLQMENKSVDAIHKQLEGLMDFTLTVDSTTYRITYSLGRKDFVLINMVGEGTLDPALFKAAFLEGFEYRFTE
jgi:hypothetical protein